MTGLAWTETRSLGFDLETTGISVWEDRIVTASLVAVEADGRVVNVSEWLVDPGVEIPDEAAAVHGVTTDRARADGVAPEQALLEVVAQLALAFARDIPVVAMNAAYDLTMLEVECRRHRAPSLVANLGRWGLTPVIDPGVLDKHADKFRKSKGGCRCGCGAEDRKLVGLCRHYGVPLDDADAHNSTADTVAACRLWRAIVARHPRKFTGYTVPSLHQAQVGWRREQMDSLRAYFDKNGEEHDGCDGSWPLLMPPQGVAIPGGAA